MKIEIYSDGSCNTVKDIGGWAFRIVVDGCVVIERGGHLPYATNNVAELFAAVEGLEEAQKLELNSELDQTREYWLISDSKLVLGYADGTYACKAQHLMPLYLKIRSHFKTMNLHVKWVKGHAGNTHNEACDKLAKSARRQQEPAG